MEFMSRGVRQAVGGEGEATHTGGKSKKSGKGIRFLFATFLTLIVLLMLALIFYLIFGGAKTEQSYVQDNKFQAVFLNGGQVYFGKIGTFNNRYLTMSNIYYLRVNQQVQPDQSTSSSSYQDISLAKLGCELHGPQDTMVINRDQVTFWENLKDDGQVVKAITQFVTANPNGQKCSDAAASSSSSTTPTTTTPTTTTPSTTTKKP